jgi:phosphoglycerate dehydrogenase-like enzyme
MPLLVQIPHQAYAKAPDDLRARLHHEVNVRWGDPEAESSKYQVLVHGRPSLKQLEASPALHTLVIPFAGIPAETRQMVIDHVPDLKVYNLHHNATATAEMAIALLLAVAKNVIPADRALRSHDWRVRYQPNANILLSGRRALVLGYGAVGSTVANMSRALGMRVDAVRRTADRMEEHKRVKIYPSSELDRLLPEADVVFVTLPLTPSTQGLINADRLACMSRDTLLVNVARGAIVEEKPLFEALRTRTIAGAGLDVWYRYPEDEESRHATAPAEYPFHELDNVVMSPHVAGGSQQNEQLRLVHLASLLNELVRQGSAPNQVDIYAGY